MARITLSQPMGSMLLGWCYVVWLKISYSAVLRLVGLLFVVLKLSGWIVRLQDSS